MRQAIGWRSKASAWTSLRSKKNVSEITGRKDYVIIDLFGLSRVIPAG